jgi:DNA invertase Pin-like site-specific DNA recombinase
MGNLYGYARVSTGGQDLSIQREALLKAGCKIIREEKVSGATRNGRAQLQTILDFIQPGDTLTVTRIDRLARSMKDLQDIVHDLKSRGVHLKATEQPVDTSTAAGKAFLDMLGVFAEFETNIRRERQAEGIARAKKQGVYKGRKPLDRAAVAKLHGEGKSVTEIAKALKITRPTVYTALREIEAKAATSPMKC